MSELETLQAQVAALEARLAASEMQRPEVAAVMAAPAPFAHLPSRPVETTVHVSSLRGSQGLPHDLRELRELAVAVALGRADQLPGPVVPVQYEPDIRRLHEARSRGLTWRAAMEDVGLEPPTEVEVGDHARALHEQLPVLWDDAAPVVEALKRRLPGFKFDDLIRHLREIVT